MSLAPVTDRTATATATVTASATERAMEAARDHLLSLQHADGWWKGELQTNVTMDAEDLFLRHVLGILDERTAQASAAWIRSQQRPDGSWATFHGGPADLSTTLEAYVALRIAGDAPATDHLRRAEAVIRAHGGPAHARVFTRMWLALLGLWRWDDLPAMPPEIVLLPASAPLSVYRFACWARQTIVPITVVSHHRPVVPVDFSIRGLHVDAPPRIRAGWRDWEGRFTTLDRVLHRYERSLRTCPDGRWSRARRRRRALAAAEAWIVERQEADGSWGGIQPPWVWSILALWCQGYALEHPVLRAAIEGLDGFVIEDGATRRLEACQSPVWDTALAVVALADAGVPPGDPALVRAADWLLDEEVTVTGDWAVQRPELPPGGWAFEFANDHYPDTDDTAEVVLALRRAGHPDRDRVDGAVRRGLRWVAGLQCRDGGFAAFDVDNDDRLPTLLPFCDFGAVTDPPSVDVTAHVVEMFAHEGHADAPVVARAIAWMSSEQEPDGSWFGRWGANHVYGTGAAVPALVAAGVRPDDPRIRRAVRWLEDHQNPDGGWGEDMRSYRDPAWRGRGHSTASQTAWALLALHAAGEDSDATRRGLAYLVDTQRPDGTWDEPWFTGTGFPWDFNINYHLYRLVFPLTALGRFVHRPPTRELP